MRNYSIPIMEYNQGVIALRDTPHNAKHHIVGDAVEVGLICIACVMSEDRHADIHMKALDMRAFEQHVE